MKDIDYDSLSFKQLFKYAEKGDEWAQYLVGLEYAFPENEEDTDDEEAVRWFRKAADAGVPEACFRMAERMFTGSGIEQDHWILEKDNRTSFHTEYIELFTGVVRSCY